MQPLWVAALFRLSPGALLDRKSAPSQALSCTHRVYGGMPGFSVSFSTISNPNSTVEQTICHTLQSTTQRSKKLVDIGRVEMTIAVANRAAMAAPYSAPALRSPRSVIHSVFRAAGAEVAQIWRTFKKDLSDPYRPELHYMRGPGPKWREKHELAGPRASADLHRYLGIVLRVLDGCCLSSSVEALRRRKRLDAGSDGQSPRFSSENSTVKQTLLPTLQPTTQ
jgi:hypothetical protein